VRKRIHEIGGEVEQAGAASAVNIDNATLAELLAQQSEHAKGHLQKALRRAARTAFLWPVEACTLLARGRPLTVLPSVGPHLERLLRGWIETPPPIAEPPEIRREFMSLTEARRVLAANPSWARKYRGDLQMHSTWSDGAGTIEDMAAAARDRHYEYIAITDHSKGLKIAGGIDEAQLLGQTDHIEALNQQFVEQGTAFRILRSLELNLSPAGEGDMELTALRRLDLVVGSFHSSLRRTEDQTDRYLAALRNPAVHILGHPRGRIYNHRLGLSAEWDRVFGEAAELDKAVEVDSYPDRQDLNVELLRIAKKAGVRIAIDTDAHSPEQLGFVELGLAAALKAGIKPERIVNFMPVADLLAWAAQIRMASSPA
jgi:histidinol phosphatase-like PHP family hydrolase